MARMRLQVKVVPGASRDEVSGWLGDSLKIRVASRPEQGEAYKAVVGFLSELLLVPRQQIAVAHGARLANKLFAIDGRSVEDARRMVTERS